jgi:hypothetical protein
VQLLFADGSALMLKQGIHFSSLGKNGGHLQGIWVEQNQEGRKTNIDRKRVGATR